MLLKSEGAPEFQKKRAHSTGKGCLANRRLSLECHWYVAADQSQLRSVSPCSAVAALRGPLWVRYKKYHCNSTAFFFGLIR